MMMLMGYLNPSQVPLNSSDDVTQTIPEAKFNIEPSLPENLPARLEPFVIEKEQPAAWFNRDPEYLKELDTAAEDVHEPLDKTSEPEQPVTGRQLEAASKESCTHRLDGFK